jgi:hypothetical protein
MEASQAPVVPSIGGGGACAGWVGGGGTGAGGVSFPPGRAPGREFLSSFQKSHLNNASPPPSVEVSQGEVSQSHVEVSPSTSSYLACIIEWPPKVYVQSAALRAD